MRVVGLVSGGKDSCFALLKCIQYGHTVDAIAYLSPSDSIVDENDSHCFQTIGFKYVKLIAEAMQIPFYTRKMGNTNRKELYWMM